jgi:hypothetical protein
MYNTVTSVHIARMGETNTFTTSAGKTDGKKERHDEISGTIF